MTKFGLVILFIASSSILLTCTQKKKDANRFVEIQGKKQQILDLGTGEPAVILVAGMGADITSFSTVQSKISTITRTIAYDRAGLGRSEMTDTVRTLDHAVAELHEILEKENISAPYILVGRSLGGHLVRYYAHVYPEQVAGMVLIDPTVEDLEDKIRERNGEAAAYDYAHMFERFMNPAWPEAMKRDAQYFHSNDLTMKTIEFPDRIPITLLVAGMRPDSPAEQLKGSSQMIDDIYQQWQTEVPRIHYIRAMKSGHFIQGDEPELVISAVQDMVEMIRKE